MISILDHKTIRNLQFSEGNHTKLNAKKISIPKTLDVANQNMISILQRLVQNDQHTDNSSIS